jgi:ribosome-binding factor A
MHNSSPRKAKVERLIQKDLSEMFQQYAKDWMQGVLISVSAVRLSPDMGIARVYLSIFPSNKAEETLAQINKINKDVRFQLGQRVKNQLRRVPELTMFIDDSLDYIEKIDDLLKK